MGLIVPAVLPHSRVDLEKKLALFATIPHVSRVQIDVVDGRFAAPASWPYTEEGVLEEMRAKGETLSHQGRLHYEIDLMCHDAEAAAGDWLALGATRLTFHAESVSDWPGLLVRMRRQYGAEAVFSSELVKFGIAINIATESALLEPAIGEIDYVQFMGIARIGVQGQLFDRRALAKISAFRARHPELLVQVDGGVSLEVGRQLRAIGVSDLVVGSALAKGTSPALSFAAFEALSNSFGV